MKVRSLVSLSNHSAFHWRSTQCVARMLLLLSDELISCAASTNGCLYLRRRAFAPAGQVSAECRRCLGSNALRDRESAAHLRRNWVSWRWSQQPLATVRPKGRPSGHNKHRASMPRILPLLWSFPVSNLVDVRFASVTLLLRSVHK